MVKPFLYAKMWLSRRRRICLICERPFRQKNRENKVCKECKKNLDKIIILKGGLEND